jgi:L-serine dehydratase
MPDKVDPDIVDDLIGKIYKDKSLSLLGDVRIDFDPKIDLVFHYSEELPHHANGVRFSIYTDDGLACYEDYYSIGGGFVLSEEEIEHTKLDGGFIDSSKNKVPYSFDTWEELYSICTKENLKISDVMLANERCGREESDITAGLFNIWDTMSGSITRGLNKDGILPGNLKVQRRANNLYVKLIRHQVPLSDLNWLNAYAIAVNEENAAGGKVVTAPTNGAAGIIPAVLYYFLSLFPHSKESQIIEYLLTTAAIGILFKKGASISAAEVGCQGEVGVACSMAAAGLCAVYGGTLSQIGNAAEMGMEHNLGLTCDPIGGLVQIPCIERNAMGAAQAINAAKLSLLGDGRHQIPLDMVIKTMKQTGIDMSHKYKETALGGLAVNLPAC